MSYNSEVMRKRKSHFGCIFFLLLLAVLCAVWFRLPQYIVSEREKTLADWTNGCAAWRARDYGTAAKCWRMNFVRSFLVRRPSKYLYWQAAAFEKLGKKEKGSLSAKPSAFKISA